MRIILALFAILFASCFSEQASQNAQSDKKALFCENKAKAQPKPKEMKMIQYWQKEKRKGGQAFIIETEHEAASGLLSWDLNNNTWKFDYEHISWEIKDNRLFKYEKGEVSSYPCVGFSEFLQHSVEKWNEILEIKHEVCNQNTCYLFVNYQKRPMIWKYHINPFSLSSVAIEDSSGRYYQIDFEVIQETIK